MKPRSTLTEQLPVGFIEKVQGWCKTHQVVLKITSPRLSKLGDYRPVHDNKPARISINNNLSGIVFIVILVHEMAHHEVWLRHKTKVPPHGNEWKASFMLLVPEFIHGFVPDSVEQAVYSFLHTKRTYRFASDQLMRVMQQFDPPENLIYVEQIPDGSTFRYHNGLIFKKITKIRKRFRCYCVSNHRYYSFGPTALVNPIENH